MTECGLNYLFLLHIHQLLTSSSCISQFQKEKHYINFHENLPGSYRPGQFFFKIWTVFSLKQGV